MASEQTLAEGARSWPFEEARKVAARIGAGVPEKGYVLFETGYGPSGLPHIGTFGEVVRTQMVRHAFAVISDVPSRLFAFSDDMDGLRKVPDNIPNPDKMDEHLGKPLTAVPRSVSAPMRALAITTMRGFGHSSTGSASTTSSRARRSATPRACSMRPCWRCWPTTSGSPA